MFCWTRCLSHCHISCYVTSLGIYFIGRPLRRKCRWLRSKFSNFGGHEGDFAWEHAGQCEIWSSYLQPFWSPQKITGSCDPSHAPFWNFFTGHIGTLPLSMHAKLLTLAILELLPLNTEKITGWRDPSHVPFHPLLTYSNGRDNKKLSYCRETARQLRTSFSARSLIVHFTSLNTASVVQL